MDREQTIDAMKPAWRVGIALAVAAAVVTAALLFFFNPAETKFYPRCHFKLFTGLDCPGCGGLRAAHQLLHGNIGAAFQLNPLLICLLPIGGWLALRAAIKRFLGRTLPQPFTDVRWVYVLAAAVIGFGILRNLPLGAWVAS